MSKTNFRRISVVVTAQTAGNLEKLRKMTGYGNVGMVIDKLVREKMVELRMNDVRQEIKKAGADKTHPRGRGENRGEFDQCADSVAVHRRAESGGYRKSMGRR